MFLPGLFVNNDNNIKLKQLLFYNYDDKVFSLV